ncbi:phage holin family protein [Promicromonospora kroppenstedtii]|uniref:phage holin family protein n=1 Tax=Promicromonospora kroppenstedtii TaxID=440482 RepID=UPI0004B64C0E|nr:phage holin family protein [Promicromonospora kroppenstedtii]
MIDDVKFDDQTGPADIPPAGAPGPDRPASLGKLVEQVSEQASRLVRAEIALAKAELAEKAKKSGIGVGLLVVALLIFAYAVGVLLLAAVYGLGTVWPLWLSALAIGGFMVLVVAVLALVGAQLLKKATTPPESVQRVKDDITSIKEGMQR